MSAFNKAVEFYGHVVDNPMPISRRKRQMFAGCYFAVGAVLAYFAWSEAADKTFRIEAKTSKQMAYKAVDSTSDFGRMMLDRDGKIISWNRGMTTLTGRTSKQMIGKSWLELAGDNAVAKEQLSHLFNSGMSPSRMNVELPRKDGEPGSTTLVQMQFREVTGETGTFRFVSVDPVGIVNWVTP